MLLVNIHLIHRDFYHFFYSIYLYLPDWLMMRLVLLRYLHFICIFMDAIKSELLTLTFQRDIMRIWVHIKLSPIYCEVNPLTNWDLHPYPPLSHLPNPTPSHNLSWNCFPKCMRNKGWKTRLQQIGRRITKNNFWVFK